ncbi:MAG: fused MFS/spermidine synthase [Lachnospiraceae bacterium]|nr:fused MFS/spermidine synthase [Lachnospiraceae bacterium]
MNRKILKNKAYLYLTEFFAGMSVMAVELGASRLLAPYFSSSQIVWTIIIGTIMIAMALGNLYGGKKADQNPDPDKLYARIIFAALWIAAIPVVGKYIIIAVSGLLIFTINSHYLVIAAFIACMIVFVFPLFLLGTVTPSLVKYTVESLDVGGSVVGRLNAANTIGSILGTFLPTFVTIPAVGTSVTFLLFSGVLLLLSVLYFLSKGDYVNHERGEKHIDESGSETTDNKVSGKSSEKKEHGNRIRLIVALIVFVLCCIFGHDTSFAFWQDDLTYEGESIYNYLQVYEDSKKTVLSTNVLFGVQSVYRKEKSLTGMYYDYAMAAPLMCGAMGKNSAGGNLGEESGTESGEDKTVAYAGQEPLRILILGMGTGTFATQCQRYFDDIYVEGVEIDEKITELARTHFALPESVQVTTYDGRAFLAACDETYDVIMVDAYQDITIPFQMSSVEFFTMVRDHLNENGVMVVNMNMRGQKEGSINDYLADTIATVFPSVYTVDVPGTTNRELFAGCDLEVGEKMTTAVRNMEEEGAGYDEDLTSMMSRVAGEMQAYDSGSYLLTDDKAPVELLGMQVIDDLIRDEVAIYREIYEQEGLEGLMRNL